MTIAIVLINEDGLFEDGRGEETLTEVVESANDEMVLIEQGVHVFMNV